MFRKLLLLAALVSAAPALAGEACTGDARENDWAAPTITDSGGAELELDPLLEQLASSRVVFIGEQHDALAHHLNQLEMVCRLHRQSQRNGSALAIGMEFFQTPYQSALDAYVRDHGDLDRLLTESEYFTRWGFDFRLYAPILRYARAHRIDLIALNAPAESVRKVAAQGPAALSADERELLEQGLADTPEDYRTRLRSVFEKHPGHEKRDFENFVAAQTLWDETMAARAAAYLASDPQHRLVVLAGGGHVDYPDGIPDRLIRRQAVRSAMLIQTRDQPATGQHASYVLSSPARSLPPKGRLGVELRQDEQAVFVNGFSENSAARDAGVSIGDRVVTINDRPIDSMASLLTSLWRGQPGDLVDLVVANNSERFTVRLSLR